MVCVLFHLEKYPSEMVYPHVQPFRQIHYNLAGCLQAVLKISRMAHSLFHPFRSCQPLPYPPSPQTSGLGWERDPLPGKPPCSQERRCPHSGKPAKNPAALLNSPHRERLLAENARDREPGEEAGRLQKGSRRGRKKEGEAWFPGRSRAGDFS